MGESLLWMTALSSVRQVWQKIDCLRLAVASTSCTSTHLAMTLTCKTGFVKKIALSDGISPCRLIHSLSCSALLFPGTFSMLR